jgi:hypothetical protein
MKSISHTKKTGKSPPKPAQAKAEPSAPVTNVATDETQPGPGITPVAAQVAPLASIPTPTVAPMVTGPVALVSELAISSIQIAPPNLADFERIIATGLATFVDVGQALTRIRDGELYKATHTSFDAYCADRWDMQRAHAYRLIDAAGVVENVSNWRQQKLMPPTVESHARELGKLPAKDQPKAWAQVVKSAPNGVVTAQLVAKVVTARLPERASKPKAKPASPTAAPPLAPPLSIAMAPVDEATAIAHLQSDIERHLPWPWSIDPVLAVLASTADKVRNQFADRKAV